MYRKKNLLVSYFFLLSCNTIVTFGEPLLGSNIETAAENEFNFIVSIGIERLQKQNRYADAHLCGGSLITRELVLTSAHCIDRFLKEIVKTRIVVTVGSNDLRNGMKYHIKSTISYDEWARNKCLPRGMEYHDIAVLKLDQCVRGGIKLPKITKRSKSEFYGHDAVTVGWGQLESGVNSLLLKKANLHILSHVECEKLITETLNTNYDVWDRNMCTKVDPSILLGCGDSGSPLLIDGNEIIAINDSVCPAEEDFPYLPSAGRLNQHISVIYYRNFIKDMIDENKKFCTIL